MRVRKLRNRNGIVKGMTRVVLGMAAFLLLFGSVGAGQRTEKLWQDINRKYSGQSLACLQDKLVVDVEYTGEVQRRDVSDTDRGGLQADRSAELALGSRYTTINRFTKKFAVLDEAGAERMREYVVPYWAGQVIAHHSAEVVDREGKPVSTMADAIQVVPAYPEASEIYQRIKNLVFRFEDLPVPCVVILNYTIEGEEAFGYSDRIFAAPIPTYSEEMQYNFPMSFLAQSPWWNDSVKILRAADPVRKTVMSAKGEMNQWFWNYKNLKPVEPEPYAAPLEDNAPRVLISPNFEQNWTKLVNWYAEGLDQVLTKGGSDRVLRGPAREAIEQYEAARKAEAERKAAEAAAAEAALSAEGDDAAGDGGLLPDDSGGLLPDDGGAVAAEEAAPPEVELPPLTDKDKIIALYQYIQKTYGVIDIPLGRDGYIPNRPVDVSGLEQIATNDLALMLLGMLRLADIDADYGVVSTADHMDLRPEWKALVQFNHPVVLARDGGDTYILDPADKASGIEDPPYTIEGQLVLVIRTIPEGETPEWVPVPVAVSSRNSWVAAEKVEYDTTAGLFRKSVDLSCRGELNRVFRERFYVQGSEAGQVAKREWLRSNFPDGVEITGWDENRGLTNDDNYEFSFDVAFPASFVEVKGDTMILSGAIFGVMGAVQRFNVDPEERQNGIRLYFEERGKEETMFTVPAGYAVASLPDELRWRAPFGSVRATYDQWEDMIEYAMEYEIEETMIDENVAEQLQQMFDQFSRNAAQKIVLVKVTEEGGA